ncbi:paramyosin-like isoform X2 [Hetaerina americana]|uniref:paramyosin-like isoform X2 n=1 Tax=Hetaerina americana TaxID=62018 RepID=UPI003A7F2AC6
MSNPKDCVCEDEWSEIQQRFEKEGLDFKSLGAEERLLHVWRWLVDAESNLRSSRKMLDKLRELQSEEMEEMESYMCHIRELAEERAETLESETEALRSRLETSQHQATTLANLLRQSGLRGVSEDSIGEQVALLIADRAKLIEELDVLKKLKGTNGVNGMNKENDLLSEIIKVSSEKEVLRREVLEMCERVQLLERASKQLELDNERLAFKLSEALAELEERETQLRQLVNNSTERVALQGLNVLWGGHLGKGLANTLGPAFTKGISRGILRKVAGIGDIPSPLRSSSGETNEDLTEVGISNQLKGSGDSNKVCNSTFVLGEVALQKEGIIDVNSNSTRPMESLKCFDSAPASLQNLVSSSTFHLSSESGGRGSLPIDSPHRLASILDSQIASSRSELVRLEEIRKMQTETENLRGQLSSMIEKYNALAIRHVQYKAKRKAQVDDLRNRLDVELSSLQCEVESLQSRLTVQRKAQRGEEALRRRVEADHRRLQEEKRKLLVSALNLECVVRDKEREVYVLQRKVRMLENANSDFLAKVLQLKYTSRPPGGSLGTPPLSPATTPTEDIKCEINSFPDDPVQNHQVITELGNV